MLFEFDNTPNENIYKLLVSTVVPRPIAWVTTQDIDGSVNAAPFSFFNAVSGNPPVVAVGIGGRGPGDVKDTGGNIRRTGEFVVNLVSNALAEQMNITAIDFDKQVNELAEAGLHTAAVIAREAAAHRGKPGVVRVRAAGDRRGRRRSRGGPGQGCGDPCGRRIRAG